MDGRPTAIDLLAGAGGATAGLRAAGFDVRAAVEIDSMAARTYRQNHPDTVVIEADIRSPTGWLRWTNTGTGA